MSGSPTQTYSVHFVCHGNTYRSRLAAAYFAELSAGVFRVSSSGVRAADGKVKSIRNYTAKVAAKHNLRHELARAPQQTTAQLLQDADVIVFLNKSVYENARRDYQFDERKCLVWNIPDIEETREYQTAKRRTVALLDDIASKTFPKIKQHCDRLYTYLTSTAWVDIITPDNQLTGLSLPIAWATDRGLWHRGVHVVVKTTDGKFVVGKRVSSIVFAPDMLEISLGGGVDAGEHPLEAAARETHEELGVKLPQHEFKPLFTSVKHSYHPHYHKWTRNHLYVYGVTLPVHSDELRPQPGEVAELRVLPKRHVQQLLKKHGLKRFGRLAYGYQFYKRAMREATRKK